MEVKILEIVLGKLTEVLAQKGIEAFWNSKSTKDHSDKELNSEIKAHVEKAITFSENISIFKAPDSKKILENSIELNISSQKRLFKGLDGKIVSELDILKSPSHTLLLGDVGAGKTTTLKRLLKKLLESIFNDELETYFPIFLKLGEIKESETLCTTICNQLGIAYDSEVSTQTYFTTETVRTKEWDEKLKEYFIKEEEKRIEREKHIIKHKIGDYELSYALAQYFNELETIILLDGLDEVNYLIKEQIFSEIKELSQIIKASKIVISSRYLQDIGGFKQFDNYEICPLTDEQKKAILKFWIDEPSKFINKLYLLPYWDLSDRPLFLTFLAILFLSNNEELPEQSIDVYRQIIQLVVREWDEDKEINVKRYSQYKSFDSYKKEDFLSELAFDLTYRQNVKKSFTHRQLKLSYLEVYRNYPALSLEDSTNIIKDIESHNGLIIETGFDNFEFSHLSLQEYLAAKYIVSIPFSRSHYSLLNIYPSPLAIATILSPRPGEWFSMLFLNNINEIRNDYQLKGDKVFEYIDRLIIENVSFNKPKGEIGYALIYLKTKFRNRKVQEKINEFCSIRFVYESLMDADKIYTKSIQGEYIVIKRKTKTFEDLPIKIIENGKIHYRDYWNNNYAQHFV